MADGRLLLVDDEVDFVESLADMLEIRGYEVHLAHNGFQALEQFAKSDYDLVVLDMKMPGMSGVECLREMRRHKPAAPVVMLTAFTRGDFIQQALELGALAVLAKPLVPEELLGMLSHIQAGRQALLVEDEQDLANELGSLLEGAGLSVHTAGSVEQAKEYLRGNAPSLLLLDYVLPDGTGRDLLDWISAHGLQLHTIVITGYPEKALPDLPYLRPSDILIKPFPPEDLIAVIHEHCPLASTGKAGQAGQAATD